MSYRSIAFWVLATVLCGAGALAHADSWRDQGHHYGRDWHSDHGNRGRDSYYYRRYGDYGRWGDSSRWRPRYDYDSDWWAGREWRRRDWDGRRHYHYRPYYRNDYYYYNDDDYYGGGYGGGWIDLILRFPLF